MKRTTYMIATALLFSSALFASGGNGAIIPEKENAKKSIMLDCEPATIPYYENFESSPSGLPDCTSALYPDGGNPWEIINNPGFGFENITLSYTGSTTEPSNAWFFTNGLQLESGVAYKLSYKYGNKDTESFEKLRITRGTAAEIEAVTDTIATHATVTGGTPQNNVSIITVPTSGIYYFGFQVYSDANQWSLMLDDIAVEPFDECGIPQNLTVDSTTDTSVEFSWDAPEGNEPGEILHYQYYITTGDTPADGPTTTEFSATSYFPLTPETEYNVFVRSFCIIPPAVGHGTWAGPVSFTTTALSAAENHFSALKIYPNPANNRVTVSNREAIEKIELRNLVGQLVSNTNYNTVSAELNVAGLASGSYFLTVYSHGTTNTVRLLKE